LNHEFGNRNAVVRCVALCAVGGLLETLQSVAPIMQRISPEG